VSNAIRPDAGRDSHAVRTASVPGNDFPSCQSPDNVTRSVPACESSTLSAAGAEVFVGSFFSRTVSGLHPPAGVAGILVCKR